MYRAVALAAAERGEDDAAAIAEAIEIEVGERVLLDGRDVTDGDPHAGGVAGASRVAADPGVRAALVRMQQAIVARRRLGRRGPRHRLGGGARRRGEGLPDRRRREERARRRAAETGADAERRCCASSTSATSATRRADRTVLEPAADAVPVDTTGLTLDEVVAQIETLAEARELR